MKHFMFQILDVASALGKAAASAHPAGALAHLGEPHPDRTVRNRRPSRWTRSRRPSTPAEQPVPPAAAQPAEPVPVYVAGARGGHTSRRVTRG